MSRGLAAELALVERHAARRGFRGLGTVTPVASAYALPVYRRLTVALLDRAVAGDSARVGLIAAKMAAVWPDLRSHYAAEMAGDPTLAGTPWPSALHATWSGDTEIIGVWSLKMDADSPAALVAACESYLALRSPTADGARAILAQIPASATARSYIRAVTTASVGSVPSVLDALISGTIAESTLPAAAPPPQPATPARPRNGTATPAETHSTTLDPMTITASSVRPQAITWPWYALGGAIAVGVAVFAVQRIRRGKKS